jgi:hypothetical protein
MSTYQSDDCADCGAQKSWNCCPDASGCGRITACSPDCPRMSQYSFLGSRDMNSENKIEFKFECQQCKEDDCSNCGEQKSWNCCSDASIGGRITACSPGCPRMSPDINSASRFEIKFECRSCKE